MYSFPSRGKRSKVHLTRYADDFVCTATSKEVLEEKIKPAISLFLEARGLQFKMSKTQIVNIQQGFDFLGFTFLRRPRDPRLNKESSTQENVLLVQPRKDKIAQLKVEIRRVITPNRPIGSIVRDLNPVLRGWSEYYRISYHSLPTFWSLGHYVWTKMWRWGRKKHPRRTASWIYETYCTNTNVEANDKNVSPRTSRKWSFGDGTGTLFDIGAVTHYRIPPMKEGLNPYIEKDRTYFETRKRGRVEAKFRGAVYRKFNHSCPHCGQSLHNGEGCGAASCGSCKGRGKMEDGQHPTFAQGLPSGCHTQTLRKSQQSTFGFLPFSFSHKKGWGGLRCGCERGCLSRVR